MPSGVLNSSLDSQSTPAEMTDSMTNESLNLTRRFSLALDVSIPHTHFCVFRGPSLTG